MGLLQVAPTYGQTNGSLPEMDRRPGEGRLVLRLSGEHDRATAPVVAAAIAGLVASDQRDLVVDMSAVTFMDASIINVLVAASGSLQDRDLQVRAPSRIVARMLDVCQLGALVESSRGVLNS